MSGLRNVTKPMIWQ